MKKRAVARNSMWIFGSQAFGALTTLIYLPLLARYLGGADYGRYSYAYAFVGLLDMLSILGTHHIVERESARERKNAGRYLGQALWMKLLFVAVTFILIALLNFMVNEPDVHLIIFICAAENLIRKYSAINRNISRAFGRMEYEFLIVTSDRAIGLVGVLFVISGDLGIVAVFLAFLLASIIQAIVSVVLVWWKLIAPKFHWYPGIAKYLWKEGLPIGLTLEAGQFYQRQGTALLNQWQSEMTVGFFSAGFRMYQFTRIIADSIVGALFPIFSQQARSSQKRLTSSFNVALRHLLLAAVFIAIATWALAPQGVRILLGKQFGDSAIVLRWLSPAIIFTFMNVLFGFFLQATNKQRLGTLTMVLALVLNLGLNIVLIPRYSLMGAVWAWLISEGVAFGLGGYFVVQQILAISWWHAVFVPMLGGVAAISIFLLLNGVAPFFTVLIAEIVLLVVVFGLSKLAVGDRYYAEYLRR